jgi:hypothetical protein
LRFLPSGLNVINDVKALFEAKPPATEQADDKFVILGAAPGQACRIAPDQAPGQARAHDGEQAAARAPAARQACSNFGEVHR